MNASISIFSLPGTFPAGTTVDVTGNYTNEDIFGKFVLLSVSDIRLVLNTGEEFPAQGTESNEEGGSWSAGMVLKLAGHYTVTATGRLNLSGNISSAPRAITVSDPGVSTLNIISPLQSSTHHYALRVFAASPIGIESVTSPTLGPLQELENGLWQTTTTIDGDPGTTLPVTITAKTSGSGSGDGLTKTISATIVLVDTTPPTLTWITPASDGQEITGLQIDIAVEAIDAIGDAVAGGVNQVTYAVHPGLPGAATVPMTPADGPTWQATGPLATGKQALLVSATDFAGNESSATRQVDSELMAPGQWLDLGQSPGQSTGSGSTPDTGVCELIGAAAVWDDTTAPSGGLHLFVRANDGHLWVDRFDGLKWQWEDHGSAGNPWAVSDSHARVGVLGVLRDPPDLLTATYVFVIGPDGHLWCRWTAGQPWQWTDLGAPGGSSIDSGLGVLPRSSGGGPAAFVQGGDGQVWVNRWPSPTDPPADPGSGWVNLNLPQGKLLAAAVGVTAAAVDAGNASAARAFAVIITDDGHLWINNADGSPSTWADLMVPTNSAASLPFGATAVRHTSGVTRVRAFVTSTDTGGLWANESDGQHGTWTSMTPATALPRSFSNPAGTRTGLTAPSSSLTGVVADDGHLWIFDWDPDAGTTGWEDAGTPGTATPPPDISEALIFTAPVAGNGATPHGYTLVDTADGHLWLRRDRHD